MEKRFNQILAIIYMINYLRFLTLNKHHLIFLLPLTIYGIWILIIYLYGVNIPILDQWNVPGEQMKLFSTINYLLQHFINNIMKVEN